MLVKLAFGEYEKHQRTKQAVGHIEREWKICRYGEYTVIFYFGPI
jgi:hypothetical protein